MASLLSPDLSGMTDCSIHRPVTVVAGRGDPLFPLTYTQEVSDGATEQSSASGNTATAPG